MLFAVLFSERASAQAGLIDPTWPSVLSLSYRQLIAEPDGSLLAVYPADYATRLGVTVVTKLLPDGSLDRDFHYDRIVASRNDFYEATLQADGKILLYGNYDFDFSPIFLRLNADGTIDPTFDPGTSWAGSSVPPGHVTVNPGGQIFLDGAFQIYQGHRLSKPVRLTPAGDYDPDFAAGTDPLIGCSAVADAGDQRIYAARYNNGITPRPYGLVRLTSSGDTDPAFTPVVTDNLIQQIFVRPDGDLVIAGWFTSVNGQPSQSVARIRSDGTVLNRAPLPPEWASAYEILQIFSDGGLLLAIDLAHNLSPMLRRLQPDDQPDPEWGRDRWGHWQSYSALATAIGPDDRVFANFASFPGPATTTRLTDSSHVEPRPPTITVQPSGTNIVLGGALRLEVTVTGEGPFTYRWSKESGFVGEASADPFLLIDSVRSADAGTYIVLVEGPGGSVPSEYAPVAVVLPVEDLRLSHNELNGQVQTDAGYLYYFEVSPTPGSNNWSLQELVVGTGLPRGFSLPISGQQAFCRVRTIRPPL